MEDAKHKDDEVMRNDDSEALDSLKNDTGKIYLQYNDKAAIPGEARSSQIGLLQVEGGFMVQGAAANSISELLKTESFRLELERIVNARVNALVNARVIKHFLTQVE